MQVETILALLVGLLLVAMPSWLLGWHYGAQSLRNRHKKLIRLMEESNNQIKESNLLRGSNWYDGFASGVSTTLTSFEMFLEKFKE